MFSKEFENIHPDTPPDPSQELGGKGGAFGVGRVVYLVVVFEHLGTYDKHRLK